MSANVDVPFTRRNVSALSQQSNAGSRQRTPQPINESMVRERLSVNLPNSFHYLSNTMPMGSRRPHRHHHRHRSSSSSSSKDSNDGDPQTNPHPSTRVAPTATDHGDGSDARARTEGRTGHRRNSSPRSSRSSSRSSSRRSHNNSSSNSSSDADDHDGEDDYNFYARLVKLDRSDTRDGVRPPQPPTPPAAASAGPFVPTGGAPLVAQCCDTVRGTLDLLDQVRLSTHDDEHHEKFFWLDLHGVPPPQPGSPEWGSRPRRWQRRQHAALRREVQDAAAIGGGGQRRQQPEVELQALWTALGLQATTIQTLTKVCQQRQRTPRPDRTSLDDIYEEELADLTYPDDRIVTVEALSMPAEATAEPIADFNHREAPESPKSRCVVAGQPLTPHASLARHRSPTHCVVLELATLLTSVPASTTAASAGAWSSTFLTHVGSCAAANEPLNDLVWAETLGRSVHTFPSGYRTAATLRRGGRGREGRQIAHAGAFAPETSATPLITSTYVICFPGGCVTWCPASTLGLVSAARREKRSAAAQQRRQRQRRRRSRHANEEDGGASSTTNTPRNRQRHSSASSTDSADSDLDDGVEVQYVKSWEQLQASVFHRLRHMASHPESSAGAAACSTAPALSTSGFVSLLLSAVCYAYLPNTTFVLGEVDAIDSMLPLVGLNVESDQADALRRVLLLRRRLAVHRRLLFQKIRLLEALDRPAMHTTARFLRTVKDPSWMTRAARASAQGSTRAGTRSSEANRRESDMDSLSGAPTPHLPDRTTAMSPFAAATAADRAEPIVHFLDTTEEPLWSRTAVQEKYAGSSKNVSGTCFLTENGEQRLSSGGVLYPSRPSARMTEPPSLNAIHKGISNVLRNLEVARTVLGNTTLIYTSTVNYNNSRTSEGSDYFALICQYIILIVLPLNIVASQWGMNCAVPFKYVEGTTPFWSIVGVMIFLGIAGLALPLYAYRAGKIEMIS